MGNVQVLVKGPLCCVRMYQYFVFVYVYILPGQRGVKGRLHFTGYTSF